MEDYNMSKIIMNDHKPVNKKTSPPPAPSKKKQVTDYLTIHSHRGKIGIAKKQP